MGLTMSPGSVISQLDSMNENLEQAVSNAETMLLNINDFLDTGDSLVGKSYDNIRNYFSSVHVFVLNAMIKYAEDMIQENNAYKGHISSHLAGIGYIDEDALEQDKELLIGQINHAYSLENVSTSCQMAMVNSLQYTLELVEKKLRQIAGFKVATAGLYAGMDVSGLNSILAESQGCGLINIGKGENVEGLSKSFTEEEWKFLEKYAPGIISTMNAPGVPSSIKKICERKLGVILMERDLSSYMYAQIEQDPVLKAELGLSEEEFFEKYAIPLGRYIDSMNPNTVDIYINPDTNQAIRPILINSFMKDIYIDKKGVAIKDDWITLYFAPTVSAEGRSVERDENANLKSWAMSVGSVDTINGDAIEQMENASGKEVIINADNAENRNIFTDQDGRFWVALGPKVINPTQDFKKGEKLEADDFLYGTLVDVHVQDEYGNEFYIPVVFGDTRDHTWPGGTFHTGEPFSPNLKSAEPDHTTVEFYGHDIMTYEVPGAGPRPYVNLTDAYMLQELVVYDGVVNY